MPLPLKKIIEKRRNRSALSEMPIGLKIASFNALFWTVVWISNKFTMVGFWWFLLLAAAPFFFFPKSIMIRNKAQDNSQIDEIETAQIETRQETNLLSIAENQSVSPLHAQVLADAKPAIGQIKSASNVASGELGSQLRKMVHSIEIVEKGLYEDASKLSQVQRLFTYYVPATADILKARGKAAGANDEKRIDEIDAMINRLEAAFADFAARIMGEDARSLEIDIKLLSQSLAAEFDSHSILSKK